MLARSRVLASQGAGYNTEDRAVHIPTPVADKIDASSWQLQDIRLRTESEHRCRSLRLRRIEFRWCVVAWSGLYGYSTISPVARQQPKEYCAEHSDARQHRGGIAEPTLVHHDLRRRTNMIHSHNVTAEFEQIAPSAHGQSISQSP